jgi:hypothetical protein
MTINEMSSYVDLAPLYGDNKEALDKIHVRDGRGLLHLDTFAEDCLLLLLPAIGTLLVLFNHYLVMKRAFHCRLFLTLTSFVYPVFFAVPRP